MPHQAFHLTSNISLPLILALYLDIFPARTMGFEGRQLNYPHGGRLKVPPILRRKQHRLVLQFPMLVNAFLYRDEGFPQCCHRVNGTQLEQGVRELHEVFSQTEVPEQLFQ